MIVPILLWIALIPGYVWQDQTNLGVSAVFEALAENDDKVLRSADDNFLSYPNNIGFALSKIDYIGLLSPTPLENMLNPIYGQDEIRASPPVTRVLIDAVSHPSIL